MATKTYEAVSRFTNAAIKYRGESPVVTKLDYALDKVFKKIEGALKESKIEVRFNEAVADLREKYATTYKKEGKEIFLLDGASYTFTKENSTALTADTRKLREELNKETVTFEPHFATIIPKDLTFDEVEAFRGFVLPEDYEIPEPEETLDDTKVEVKEKVAAVEDKLAKDDQS